MGRSAETIQNFLHGHAGETRPENRRVLVPRPPFVVRGLRPAPSTHGATPLNDVLFVPETICFVIKGVNISWVNPCHVTVSSYTVLTYPRYVGLVHAQVLDLRLLLEWDSRYPCTDEERKVHAAIAGMQRNQNPFVTNPSLASSCVWNLVDIVSKKLPQQEDKDGCDDLCRRVGAFLCTLDGYRLWDVDHDFLPKASMEAVV